MPAFTTLDWIAIGLILLFAIGGWRRGLIASALSLLGLAAGAFVGSKVGPHLLRSGAASQWTPVASLVGAVIGATLLQTLAALAGSFVRGGLRVTPFRLFDSIAGVFFGAVTGVAFVWVLSATALLVPGQTQLRRDVASSVIVRRLDEALPPRRALNLLARIDPFPSIVGPDAPGGPVAPAIVLKPAVHAAEQGVVRVVGTACGVGIEGSGWFATPHRVITAAHVVAGEDDTTVEIPGRPRPYQARVIMFNAHDDVAVLQVGSTSGRALPTAQPRRGTAVAILGYPENGALSATPGRIGDTSAVLTRDAYGRGPVTRTITAVAAAVRHGNSGGPAVDARGRVETTIFAARVGEPVGYGVPTDTVERALRGAHRPVSTGACAS